MSKNQNTIIDEDNEYSDWLELYNNTNEIVNLENYSLSDDFKNLNKWQLPLINIYPDSSLLIFASGKNRKNITELHTNFKLSSEGESLYLSNYNNVLIDSISAVNLGEDESYGRLPNGSQNIIYLESETPGTSNNNTSQIFFSTPAGFYNNPFKLNLSSFLGDSIYYSLDGSIPTQKSNLFSDSIFIYDCSFNPNFFSEFPTSPEQSLISYKAWESPSEQLDKANIIRCVSYKNGSPSSKVYTSTYFIDKNINIKYDMPVISLITEEYNLFDNNVGIYIPGVSFNENDPEWTGNYFQKGLLWERPIHIEYFDKNGILKFSQDAGLRIHGGKTRQAAQKSLRLYARNDYGKKYFNHSILPNTSNSEYKRFILRTSMASWGDQTIIKDALAHNIVDDLNIEIQDFQPAIVFLNGEYWGVHTIRDRIDEYYIEYQYNIDKDSVDLIDGSTNYIISGDNTHYLNVIDFLEKNNLNNTENYEYINKQIDIDNHIDYQISQMFFANYDWPSNNVRLWRPQTEDGKWRWIFYDLDGGLSDAQYNMFTHCTNTDDFIIWPNSPSSTFLFRKLLESPEFVTKFINRCSEILEEHLTLNSILPKSINLKQQYINELGSHIFRWNYPEAYLTWEEQIENILIDFLEERPCFFEQHIVQFFNLPILQFNCFENNITSKLSLSPNPNNGSFFILNNSSNTIRGDLRISHITGKKIYEEKNCYLNGHETKHIRMSHFSPGLYVLSYVTALNSESIKFIMLKHH